jgi:23S rRNA pseudouridine2605 synthase
MRLVKYLARCGVASRRASEGIVRAGRVEVDGEIVVDPAREVDASNRVLLDGAPLAGPQPPVVIALHKPVGVLSTALDPHGRPTVLELLPARGMRLYPVGRLDADSSGLLLLTNDGDLAYRLTHPSFEVPKSYRARVAGAPVGAAALRVLREGVELEDGITAPAHVRRLRADLLELTIHEGRNRQVRRMGEAVGHRVLELQRIRFGPLRLGSLGVGEHRVLSAAEQSALRAL